MKKFLKVLSLVLVFTLVLAIPVSLAVPITVNPNGDGGGTISGPVTEIVGKIIGVLQVVGYAIAIVMVLWLGIQWMIAQPAKKAELKGKMWSMAIGILLLVGGVTILNIVWDLATQTQEIAA